MVIQTFSLINEVIEKKGFIVTKLNEESETEVFFEVYDLFDKKTKQARILKWNGSYKGSLQLQQKDVYVHHCTL